MSARKQPNPIDQHVAARLRMRRVLLKLSQERLGEAAGVTFQQVQKYEKGRNRIGASRLYAFAKALDVPVSFFFEGLAPTGGNGGGLADHEQARIAEVLASRDGIALSRAFSAIASPHVRKSVIALCRSLANGGAA